MSGKWMSEGAGSKALGVKGWELGGRLDTEEMEYKVGDGGVMGGGCGRSFAGTERKRRCCGRTGRGGFGNGGPGGRGMGWGLRRVTLNGLWESERPRTGCGFWTARKRGLCWGLRGRGWL